MNSSKDPRITPAYGNYPDATINAGLSYYLSEHFGLTAEAGYRRFEYHQGFNARGGIIISF